MIGTIRCGVSSIASAKRDARSEFRRYSSHPEESTTLRSLTGDPFHHVRCCCPSRGGFRGTRESVEREPVPSAPRARTQQTCHPPLSGALRAHHPARAAESLLKG